MSKRKSQLSQEEINRWFAQGIGALVVIAGLSVTALCLIIDPKGLIWGAFLGAFLVVAGLGVAIPQSQAFLVQIFSSLLIGFGKKIPGKIASIPHKETPPVSAPPATSRTLELPHEEGPLPQIGTLWRSVDEARQPIFDVLGPSYILDDTYHFLDWNPAFDEVVAKQLELRRGWHAGTFIDHLQNLSEVVERSKEVFAPGKIPLIDTEVLEFKSEKYGLIKFQKIASQIADEHGGIKAWAVNLNILEAEDEVALWNDIQMRLSREINWSKYAVSYDNLLLNFDDYLELLDKIVGEVGDAQRCIDIGAGTGNGTVRLLKAKPDREVWAVDNNEAMLQYLNDKATKIPDIGGRPVIVKEDVQRLEEYPSVYFDAAILINVLYAVDDRLKCLRQVHRLLKPGGLIVLSTSHNETDLDRLFFKIRDVLKSKGKWEELKDDFRQARNRHREMDGLIHRDSKEDIRSYIEQAGFSIKKWLDGEYVGAVVIVVAEKVIN
ncbi:MAG: class I SAM-dependent methyltransferase [Planctomycetota bacterium]|jgi:demethylmenaquinone methyltransferase/2-methoxy-6-polyprenyl-1,4-benzoquinol methylase